MDGDAVRVLADEVLKPILGPVGFTSSEVEERENYAGEEASFVKVRFAPGSRAVGGRVYDEALWSVSKALQSRGEKRFAHLLWAYSDEPPEEADRDPDDGDGA